LSIAVGCRILLMFANQTEGNRLSLNGYCIVGCSLRMRACSILRNLSRFKRMASFTYVVHVSSPKALDQADEGTAIPARCATRSAKVGVVSGVTMRSRR